MLGRATDHVIVFLGCAHAPRCANVCDFLVVMVAVPLRCVCCKQGHTVVQAMHLVVTLQKAEKILSGVGLRLEKKGRVVVAVLGFKQAARACAA
jgi:hypothetical protein